MSLIPSIMFSGQEGRKFFFVESPEAGGYRPFLKVVEMKESYGSEKVSSEVGR